MNLRTALANIHRDTQWWRKILIGGALMLTIVGYPWGAGLVMESLDLTRKGFPTPLPPWRAWGDRYVIGLLAVLIDILFFVMPIFAITLLFLCLGVLLLTSSGPLTSQLAPALLGLLALYELLVFATSIAPIGRLLYAEFGRVEQSLGLGVLRVALAPRARPVYARARLMSLPAYLPALALAIISWLLPWPLKLAALWLTLSALLYAHLVTVQLYAAAESDVLFG